MQHRVLAIMVLGLLAPNVSTHAQTVIFVPGKRIEVVGLRRWTIPMIQDSLRKYADGVTLESHACAAALRYKLGFADASATNYGVWQGDSVQSIFISVVEPQDSARVNYRSAPMDTTAFLTEWASTSRLVDRNMGALAFVLDEISYRRAGRQLRPIPKQLDSTAVETFRSFLASHSRNADAVLAQRVLVNDPNDRSRIVAAAILANFTEKNTSLFSLVEAMRENDGRVKQIARQVLFNFAQDAPRRVDWKPATRGLHAILNGTSLFQAQSVMDLLVATRVNPALAGQLLKHGGQAVTDYLGAQHPWPRESAHKLLVALSGHDFGYAVPQWRHWIDTL